MDLLRQILLISGLTIGVLAFLRVFFQALTENPLWAAGMALCPPIMFYFAWEHRPNCNVFVGATVGGLSVAWLSFFLLPTTPVYGKWVAVDESSVIVIDEDFNIASIGLGGSGTLAFDRPFTILTKELNFLSRQNFSADFEYFTTGYYANVSNKLVLFAGGGIGTAFLPDAKYVRAESLSAERLAFVETKLINQEEIRDTFYELLRQIGDGQPNPADVIAGLADRRIALEAQLRELARSMPTEELKKADLVTKLEVLRMRHYMPAMVLSDATISNFLFHKWSIFADFASLFEEYSVDEFGIIEPDVSSRITLATYSNSFAEDAVESLIKVHEGRLDEVEKPGPDSYLVLWAKKVDGKWLIDLSPLMDQRDVDLAETFDKSNRSESDFLHRALDLAKGPLRWDPLVPGS